MAIGRFIHFVPHFAAGPPLVSVTSRGASASTGACGINARVNTC